MSFVQTCLEQLGWQRCQPSQDFSSYGVPNEEKLESVTARKGERFAGTALRFHFFGQVEVLADEVGATPSAFLFRSRGGKNLVCFHTPAAP
jgi:hypothetical protein